MKVLIIRPYASVLNKELYNLQHVGLAKAFLRKNHRCDIIYYIGNGEEKIEKIECPEGDFLIYWMKGRVIEKSVIFDKERIEDIIKDYDIVQIEEYEQIFSCYLALRHPEKVIIYHGPYKCDFNRRYYLKSKIFDIIYGSRMRNKKIQFITKTNKAKQTLEAKGFTNIIISPVGLDVSKFDDSDVDYSYMSTQGEFKLLYIGELCRRRCTLFLIDILKQLRERGINATLTLVGKGKPYYVKKCKKRAVENKVQQYISFIGSIQQDKLQNVYCSHDVFLLPTRFEIFGMVLLEAMFFGRPILTSKSAGSEMLISDGVNGVIANNFSTEEWVNKLEAMYYGKYDIPSMMRRARADVLEHFTWDESADIFINIYKKHLQAYSVEVEDRYY